MAASCVTSQENRVTLMSWIRGVVNHGVCPSWQKKRKKEKKISNLILSSIVIWQCDIFALMRWLITCWLWFCSFLFLFLLYTHESWISQRIIYIFFLFIFFFMCCKSLYKSPHQSPSNSWGNLNGLHNFAIHYCITRFYKIIFIATDVIGKKMSWFHFLIIIIYFFLL